MSSVERACTALAQRYLAAAEADPDPLHRLALLDCALGAVQDARQSALSQCRVPPVTAVEESHG